jgi:hypothetical protein
LSGREKRFLLLVSGDSFSNFLSFYKTVLAEKPSVLDINCESTSDVEEKCNSCQYF